MPIDCGGYLCTPPVDNKWVAASAVDANGNPINPAALHWFSNNALIADVGPDPNRPGEALVGPGANGTTDIEVGCVGCSSTAQVQATVAGGIPPAEPPFDIRDMFTSITGPGGTPGRLVEGPAPVGMGPRPQVASVLDTFVSGSTSQQPITLAGPTTHILIGVPGASNHYDITLPNVAQAGSVLITFQLGSFHPPFFEVYAVTRDTNGYYSEGEDIMGILQVFG